MASLKPNRMYFPLYAFLLAGWAYCASAAAACSGSSSPDRQFESLPAQMAYGPIGSTFRTVFAQHVELYRCNGEWEGSDLPDYKEEYLGVSPDSTGFLKLQNGFDVEIRVKRFKYSTQDERGHFLEGPIGMPLPAIWTKRVGLYNYHLAYTFRRNGEAIVPGSLTQEVAAFHTGFNTRIVSLSVRVPPPVCEFRLPRTVSLRPILLGDVAAAHMGENIGPRTSFTVEAMCPLKGQRLSFNFASNEGSAPDYLPLAASSSGSGVGVTLQSAGRKVLPNTPFSVQLSSAEQTHRTEFTAGYQRTPGPPQAGEIHASATLTVDFD